MRLCDKCLELHITIFSRNVDSFYVGNASLTSTLPVLMQEAFQNCSLPLQVPASLKTQRFTQCIFKECVLSSDLALLSAIKCQFFIKSFQTHLIFTLVKYVTGIKKRHFSWSLSCVPKINVQCQPICGTRRL